MAQPAPSYSEQNRATPGYFRVPNSFAENQYLLKQPASRALALIIFRRTNSESAASVTNRNWEAWTGFHARQKEYAVKELEAFGLVIKGKGELRKFSWDWERWNRAVRTPINPAYDPNRQEREARRKLQNMHPACRARGCQLNGICPPDRSNPSQNELLQLQQVASKFVQPAAQSEIKEKKPEAPKKPVQKSDDRSADERYPQAFRAMKSFNPTAQLDLLKRLILALMTAFGVVTDSVLAKAVELAFLHNSKLETRPGLLLYVVPDVLRSMRDAGVRLDEELPPGFEMPLKVKPSRGRPSVADMLGDEYK